MRRADNRLDRERDAVRSEVVRIIEHLLKLEYAPAADPRFDWMASVEARRALADKITATLQRDAEANAARALCRCPGARGHRLAQI
jgi:hypothetical protein